MRVGLAVDEQGKVELILSAAVSDTPADAQTLENFLAGVGWPVRSRTWNFQSPVWHGLAVSTHPMIESTRTDKWLWAVRFCKTRSLAAEWCASGKVKRGGHPLKAATAVRPGDVLEVPFPEGPGVRRITVLSVIQLRVGAPEARACYDDLTNPEVYEALKLWQAAKHAAAKGRPTKKDRREIDKIHGFWD